jgi:hypothetical protein
VTTWAIYRMGLEKLSVVPSSWRLR